MAHFSFSANRFLAFLACGAILSFAAPVVPSASAAPADLTAAAAVRTALPNLGKTLLFNGWMTSPDRYERMQRAVILSPGRAQVKLFTCNFTTGGTAIPLGVDTTLTLTLDGNAVATAAVRASDVAVTFNVDLTGLAEGWYMASVTGLDGSWSVLDYGVYVLKGAVAQPHASMPVTTASHELMFEGGRRYQQAWVPTKYEPVTIPYPSREFPSLPVVPARKDVVITSLAVPRPGDLYRPALTKEGVWTTANRENYFYFDFEQPKPILPMLDGPRGRGSITSPVHLEVGSAAPNGVLRGNVYFIESWRIGKVTPDGTVVTLAGYRHRDIASYWGDPTSAELVGDWSSIPAERRGFAQPWGMAWDPRTLGINEQAAPIPGENNERPHVLGPALYVSDTYRNRVVKIEYSATAHGVPPKVTEFVTGLNQPWDVIAVGTQLYVSDRMNNAIKVFDMDTAALLRTIPVVQPEGMALLDGWLYYASVRSKSIRKINLTTNEDVLITDPTVAGSNMGYYINGNSRYMKIAVSDGSFGPRGMIAYTTWSNSYYGYPVLIDGATGKMIDWLKVNSGETVKGTSPLGLGSYASAVGIGHGRMLFGTAEEGLHVVSKALPTDPVIDKTQYNAGRDQWQARGYGLTHGPGGYGFYGLPLPWGATPEIDYFLRANLHGAGLPGGGAHPSVGTSSSSLAFGNVAVGQTSAPQTITVSNIGTADATNMAYPAAPAKFTKGGTCSGPTLARGASCTLTFTYSPTSVMTDSATYTISGGGGTLGISLSGAGTSAASASLAVAPASIAFGSVTVGQTSGARIVTVSNTGSAAAAGVNFTSSNAAKFALSANTCGTSIAAGASCSVSVSYSPSAPAADSGNLTVTSTGGMPVVVAMSGTGTSGPVANLVASPASLVFGSVTLGSTSAVRTVTVTNRGGAQATAVSVVSGSAARFPVSANTCGATLAAGASCSFSVAYAPSTAGTESGSVAVGHAGGANVVVPVTGSGTTAGSASLAATPTSVGFGNVTIGQTSRVVTVTVTNTRATDATDVSFANSNAAHFAITANTCGTSIGAGASCTFAVTFSPAAAGESSAAVTLTHAGGGALTVALSGRGAGGTQPAGAGQLLLEAAVTLPDTAVGATSGLKTVTVTNTGSSAVSVTGVTSSSGEFAIASNGCGSVEAGGTCSFALTFSPSAAGARSAVITVASNAQGSPRRSLAVLGNGVAGGGNAPPAGTTAVAVEYYHPALDHYFFTGLQDEVAQLDKGTFSGWARTGQQFNVYAAAATGREAVCRFFSTAFGIKSSHFYTSDPAECSVVRSNVDWQFEGGVFYATSPALDGTCPTGMNPVYRMYNNGQGGAPNHRYTIDLEVQARMLALGWIAEGHGPMGVIMCAPQ